MLIDLYEINLSVEQKELLKNGYSDEIIDNVSTYKIKYLSGDVKVSGYLSYPRNPEKKYPVIIWNRGGFKRSGRLDDFLASGILGEIAAWNFVVLSSNYRKNDEIGGKDVDDVMNLIEVAKEFPFADCEKMGIEGWSRGGMMTYKVLQRTSDFKCAIIVSGLADMRRSVEINTSLRRMVNSLNLSDYEDFIHNRTSLNFIDKINTAVPIFFIHGTGDNRISYKDSVEMHHALSERNKNTEYGIKLIENGDHVLRRHRKLVSELKRNWYNKYLL